MSPIGPDLPRPSVIPTAAARPSLIHATAPKRVRTERVLWTVCGVQAALLALDFAWPLHVAAVGWLGAVMVFLGLAIIGLISESDQTVWHRVYLEGVLPPECRAIVSLATTKPPFT